MLTAPHARPGSPYGSLNPDPLTHLQRSFMPIHLYMVFCPSRTLHTSEIFQGDHSHPILSACSPLYGICDAIWSSLASPSTLKTVNSSQELRLWLVTTELAQPGESQHMPLYLTHLYKNDCGLPWWHSG